MLLKSGCDANMSRADGSTALHVAAGQGHVGVVRLLLTDGADPLLTNVAGETPLHVAAGCSSLQVVQLLLEHVHIKSGGQAAAAFVNARNAIGETSLHAVSDQESHLRDRAASGQSKGPGRPDRDIAQALLQAGGDVSLGTYEVTF